MIPLRVDDRAHGREGRLGCEGNKVTSNITLFLFLTLETKEANKVAAELRLREITPVRFAFCEAGRRKIQIALTFCFFSTQNPRPHFGINRVRRVE